MNKPIIASPQVTNHILHRFKLRADKKLGQNFLIDENIVRRIVEAAELSPADSAVGRPGHRYADAGAGRKRCRCCGGRAG